MPAGGARPNSGPKPRPKLRRKAVTLRLPRDLAERLRELSERLQRSQADIVADALARYPV